MKRRLLGLAVLVFALYVPAIVAQDTASVTGTVTDPTGAVIARASVAKTRTGTDNKLTSSTNEKRRRVLLDCRDCS